MKKILYVASVEQESYDSLSRAATLAGTNQAALTLVSVVTPPRGSKLLHRKSVFDELLQSQILDSRQHLTSLCEHLDSNNENLGITTEVLVGKLETEVIKEVLRGEYDLVVKASEEADVLSSAFFGSVDINLMRKCPCPVLILKPHAAGQFKVVVAAIDRDEEAPENHLLNLEILKCATWLALAESADLHLIHTWTLPFESLMFSRRSTLTKEEVDQFAGEEEAERKQWIGDLIKEFATDNEAAVNYAAPVVHLIRGQACPAIAEATRELDADLIVMGSVGRIGAPGLFMGNTSETILQQVDCSGLTIKPPGFVSPISLDNE